MVVTLLIFLTVPSIYLFESFVPLLIGGPLIVIAAIYGSVRALAPGGEMDQGYEKVGLAMAPLGFEVTERPKVNIETRDAMTGAGGAEDPRRAGAERRAPRPAGLGAAGQRRGEQHQRGDGPRRRARVRGEVARRPRAPGEGRADTPAAIAAALEAVPNSTRWKKLEVEGGPQGIVVSRKGGDTGRLALRPLARRAAGRGGLTARPPARLSSTRSLYPFHRCVGLGGNFGVGQLDTRRQLDVQVAGGVELHAQTV